MPVLAATANTDLARDVFLKLCRLQTDISAATDEGNSTRWAIVRQLQELFRAMPPNVAVSGILSGLSPDLNAVEYRVVVELSGVIGDEEPDLRSQLHGDLRQKLRTYLKAGVPFALDQDDFSGRLKAHVAMALATVKEPEDMADLHRLIRGDIKRVSRGMVARLRGERGLLADGAVTRWSIWYTRALTRLDPRSAEEVLLEILCEPEYEQDAARALVQMARTEKPEERLVFKTMDYRVVWEARANRQPNGFDESRCQRYAIAIKERISKIMEERSQSGDPDSFNSRLKELAETLAVIDARESAEFVMEVMELSGDWDGWTRADALEALLFSGARLGAEAALKVLNPTIDDTRTRTYYDQQAVTLLRRCLCLFPFLDPPSIGIARIREVLAAKPLPLHEVRELLPAIGQSRCDDALGLLLGLARAAGNGFQVLAGEWIDAVAELDTPESKRVLLSFVDPDIEHVGVDQQLEHHDRERLVSRVVDVARAESAVRDRLFLLCAMQLPPAIRLMLAAVIARLGTLDALVVGLDLIHDNANPPIPYELVRGLEGVFLERRPYGNTGNAYTLEPRTANEIRSRLFKMLLNDDNRRRSAWALLGQIESWRLEYGRPNSEPRHPAFDSGEPWPPIKQLGAFELSRSSGQEQ